MEIACKKGYRNKTVLDEYGAVKNGSRAVSVLDAKLSAMQNLIYGIKKTKKSIK